MQNPFNLAGADTGPKHKLLSGTAGPRILSPKQKLLNGNCGANLQRYHGNWNGGLERNRPAYLQMLPHPYRWTLRIQRPKRRPIQIPIMA
jgi:hypothetical protein